MTQMLDAMHAIEGLQAARGECDECEMLNFREMLKRFGELGRPTSLACNAALRDGWSQMPDRAGVIKRCQICRDTPLYPWADKLDPVRVLAYMKTMPNDHAWSLSLLKETLMTNLGTYKARYDKAVETLFAMRASADPDVVNVSEIAICYLLFGKHKNRLFFKVNEVVRRDAGTVFVKPASDDSDFTHACRANLALSDDGPKLFVFDGYARVPSWGGLVLRLTGNADDLDKIQPGTDVYYWMNPETLMTDTKDEVPQSADGAGLISHDADRAAITYDDAQAIVQRAREEHKRNVPGFDWADQLQVPAVLEFIRAHADRHETWELADLESTLGTNRHKALEPT